jgi:hypothetical protein
MLGAHHDPGEQPHPFGWWLLVNCGALFALPGLLARVDWLFLGMMGLYGAGLGAYALTRYGPRGLGLPLVALLASFGAPWVCVHHAEVAPLPESRSLDGSTLWLLANALWLGAALWTWMGGAPPREVSGPRSPPPENPRRH